MDETRTSVIPPLPLFAAARGLVQNGVELFKLILSDLSVVGEIADEQAEPAAERAGEQLFGPVSSSPLPRA